MKKFVALLLLAAALFASCATSSNTIEAIKPDIRKHDTVIEKTTQLESQTEPLTTSETMLPEKSVAEQDVVSEPVATEPEPTEDLVREVLEWKEHYDIDVLEGSTKILRYFGDFDENKIQELEKLLQSYDKKISIAIYSLDESKALSYNTSARYSTGCTIKMPYFMYVCSLFDQGIDSPESVMTYEQEYYAEGSGTIKKTKYGTDYKLSELIHLGLSVSDNVAYKMLHRRFGVDGYNEFAEEHGWDSIHLKGMWLRTANPVDFIRVWKDAYEYFQSDAQSVEMLKEACTNTVYSYIHKGLGDVEYSHKSGHQDGDVACYNDAGIMWTGNQYLYAVFTNSDGTSADQKFITKCFILIHELMQNK